MLKPDSLRARLTEAFPDIFVNDAARLQLWIEDGQVRCHAAPDNLNYTVEYKLSVSITGWSLSSLLIWIVVINWLRVQQPDLLAPATSAKSFPFEADLISANEVDIGFDLRLTEPVRVTKRRDGGFDMQVVPEPDPLFEDAGPLLAGGALLDGVRLRQIWGPGDAPVQIVPVPPAP